MDPCKYFVYYKKFNLEGKFCYVLGEKKHMMVPPNMECFCFVVDLISKSIIVRCLLKIDPIFGKRYLHTTYDQ